MFKYNRKKRYDQLIACGFMTFEARWLSTIPFKGHPAMTIIMQKRRKLYEKRREKRIKRVGAKQSAPGFGMPGLKRCTGDGTGLPVATIRRALVPARASSSFTLTDL